MTARFNKLFFDMVEYGAGDSPTTPSTGEWVCFFRPDGIYVKDDAGTITGPLGAGGGGYHDVAVHARQTSDQTGIVTSTNTVVKFPQEDKDTNGYFDGSTGKFLPTSTTHKGTYRITTHVAIGSLADGKSIWVGVRKNGTTMRWIGLVAGGAATTVGVGGALDVYLDGVDDYVEIIVWHNHGSDRDTYSGSADDVVWFGAVRIAEADLCGW